MDSDLTKQSHKISNRNVAYPAMAGACELGVLFAITIIDIHTKTPE
ncbi:hypothetical protein KJ365_14405 [Glaciecola sp. XM2]|jgi:hypothetical protein|nr:hypothetical protein [Glaciecola sp. XM2]MBT1452081.1 hypothetical protein [Glaciecola sp. XM2]